MLLLTLALSPAVAAAGTFSAAGGSSGAKSKGVTYKGKTSQGDKFSMTVTSPSKGKVTKGLIDWKQTCSGEFTSLTGGTTFKNVKISGGSFHLKGKYSAPVTSSGGGSYVGDFTASISGKTSSSKASGTFSISTKIYSGSTEVSSCKAEGISWSAKKA